MNSYWKAAVILGLAAVVGAPLLTLHATLAHIAGATTLGPRPRDPGLAWLLLLNLSSLVPVVLLGVRAPTIVCAVRLISTLAQKGDLRVLMDFDVIELPTDELLYSQPDFVGPAPFVSRGAIDALGAEEIKAALLHERAHITAHDTSWRTALIMVSRAYSFVPHLRTAVHSLRTDIEIRADRRAVADGASAIALFDALVKVGTPLTAARVPTARFSDGSLELRLQSIAESGGTVALPTRWLMGASIAGLASVPLAAHALLAYEIICHRVMA